MTSTKEVTLWCNGRVRLSDNSEVQCPEWVQFPHNEAAGTTVLARKLAKRLGWRSGREDQDFCPKHH